MNVFRETRGVLAEADHWIKHSLVFYGSGGRDAESLAEAIRHQFHLPAEVPSPDQCIDVSSRAAIRSGITDGMT